MRPGHRVWVRALVLLLALAGIGVTAALGRWQLGRAPQKQAIVQAREAQAAKPELDGRTLAQAGQNATERDALLYRRLALKGQWLSGHTVHLDNRQMHGRPGFYVLTPLQLQDAQAVVLVQRGWAPRNFLERTRLPEITTPAGPVQLEGRLAGPPARLYEFTPTAQGEGSSRIRQNLELAAFAAETGLALAPLTVVQTQGPADGLLRQWPAFSAGVEKHHGYAFQWFGLSGLIALLYVWFQFVRRLHPRSPRTA